MSLVTGVTGSSEDVLRLLANPELLRERLEQYEKAKKDAEEKILLVAPADDIPYLRAQSDGDRRLAAEALAAAQQTKEQVIAQANADAAELLRVAKDEAQALRDEAHKIRNDAQVKQAELEAATKKVAAELAALANQRAELERLQAVARKAEEAAALSAKAAQNMISVVKETSASFIATFQTLTSSK